MNIALVHYRVGETDGVSLEMDKWKKILDNMGHKTFYIAGSSGTSESIIVDELHYRDEYDLKLGYNCYEKLEDYTEAELIERIETLTKTIEDKFVKIIEENKIEVLVPNNILAIGRSIPIAEGIINAAKRTGIKIVNHHHDFYWERANFDNPTCDYVVGKLNEIFPPLDFGDKMRNAVINSPAKADLKAKKGLEATVVPNVFDFNAPVWGKDEYNKDFKDALGIKDNQVYFLQATRVTNRKAIELAIDLIAELNKPENKAKMIGKTLYDGKKFDENTEYVLALVGLHEGGDNYEAKLVEHAEAKNVNMIVNPDLVDHSRTTKDGKKVYSLWDAYVYADMITYPSIYEGWGNQFLEGLFAKKPQVVFEYSIYEADIKQVGFNIVSLGNKYDVMENKLVEIDNKILENAADETIKYLTDNDFRQKMVEENFELGKKHYSLDALEVLLKDLFANL